MKFVHLDFVPVCVRCNYAFLFCLFFSLFACRKERTIKVTNGNIQLEWHESIKAGQLSNPDWNVWVASLEDKELGSGFPSVQWRNVAKFGPLSIKPIVDREPLLVRSRSIIEKNGSPTFLENTKNNLEIETFLETKNSVVVRKIHKPYSSKNEDSLKGWRIQLSRKNFELILPYRAPYDTQTELSQTETHFLILRSSHAQPNASQVPHLVLASRQSFVCSSDDEQVVLEIKNSETDIELFIAAADSTPSALQLGAQLVGIQVQKKAKVLLDVRELVSRKPIPARILVEAQPQEPLTVPLVIDPTRSFETEALFIDATLTRNEIELPAGRYTFRATHGIGWSIDRQTLEIQNSDSQRVSLNLVEEVKKENWVGCDLHVHAKGSFDARQVTYEDRVRSLVAVGVECVAATEHNHIGDYGPVTQTQGFSSHLRTMLGVELTTGNFGHFNVYPWRKDATIPFRKFSNLQALFNEVRLLHKGYEHVLQLNHPRMRNDDGSMIGYLDMAGVDAQTGKIHNASVPYIRDYDALEVFNGYQLGDLGEVRKLAQEWIRMLDRGDIHVATGSSDSHAFTFPWAGFPRTFINVGSHWQQEGRPIYALIHALKQGKAFVSSGPIVFVRVHDASLGEQTKAESAVVHVEVWLTSWQHSPTLELYLGTKLLRQVAMQSSEKLNYYSLQLPLPPVMRKQALVAIVEAELHPIAAGISGMKKTMAITNPIWVVP